MPEVKDALLEELVNARWEIMKALADAAEEDGEQEMALGWRWMAENKKWPASGDLIDHVDYGFYIVGRPQDAHSPPDTIPADTISTTRTYWPVSNSLKECLTRVAFCIGKWIIANEPYSPAE